MSVGAGAPERLTGALVSGRFFEVLGTRAWRGRLLGPDDDRVAGHHPVAVISYGIWRRVFGGSDEVIGRTVRLNGHPFTIVGVTPPGVVGVSLDTLPDLWTPMAMVGQIMPEVARRVPGARHPPILVARDRRSAEARRHGRASSGRARRHRDPSRGLATRAGSRPVCRRRPGRATRDRDGNRHAIQDDVVGVARRGGPCAAHRVCGCRRVAAGPRRTTAARDGGTRGHGRDSLAPRTATADRKPAPGRCRDPGWPPGGALERRRAPGGSAERLPPGAGRAWPHRRAARAALHPGQRAGRRDCLRPGTGMARVAAQPGAGTQAGHADARPCQAPVAATRLCRRANRVVRAVAGRRRPVASNRSRLWRDRTRLRDRARAGGLGRTSRFKATTRRAAGGSSRTSTPASRRCLAWRTRRLDAWCRWIAAGCA